jgi:hypothetical protein
MVVATETNEGEVATVVRGIYDGHFGCVWGCTNKHSVKLTLLHEVARPWAKGTANDKETLRKSSVRMLNLKEMEWVATWKKGHAIKERIASAQAGRGPEAKLLAKLIALMHKHSPS